MAMVFSAERPRKWPSGQNETNRGTKSRHQIEAPNRGTKSRHQIEAPNRGTKFVEHPDLVAERLLRYADIVGRDSVMTGTDCGFSQSPLASRVHRSIMWAKLKCLARAPPSPRSCSGTDYRECSMEFGVQFFPMSSRTKSRTHIPQRCTRAGRELGQIWK